MFRYALTIFVGAFLLFQVQPLISKIILPWFGGGPAIWTTCMLFFQLLLLAGYAYAHLIVVRLSPKQQGLLHLGLLALSLAFLPISPTEDWKPTPSATPQWQILLLLMVTVGMPYWLLSATGPLLQGWFSRTHPGRSPYRLYALSNIGSMLALLSYPFLVEPALRLSTQTDMWSWSYALFAVCCGVCALQSFRRPGGGDLLAPAESTDSAEAPERPRARDQIFWLALSACGSAMLLAVTNQMCQDVAVIPFLWVLPLALYLLSFVICFGGEGFYVRGVFLSGLAVSMWLTWFLLARGVRIHIGKQIVGYSITLLLCCMVCHGELYRCRPNPRHLTRFYLMVSLGGALGGVCVTLLAPMLLVDFFELHIALVCTCLLALYAMYRDADSRMHRGWWRLGWLVQIGLVAWLAVSLYTVSDSERGRILSRTRNFYGVLIVTERSRGEKDKQEKMIFLKHGRIDHGSQYLVKERRHWATSYYTEASGVGLALLHHPRRGTSERPMPLRVGVIGLGAGTLATYGRKGDYYCFYEINPEVERLARHWFTFLKDCAADEKVVLGDARIQLERQDSQQFDVLAVDAFSSDAIPVHLLTRECFTLYWRHLRKDGVLAIHISNRYLNLGPVVLGLAEEADYRAVLFSGKESMWVLVTRNTTFLDNAKISSAITPWPDKLQRLIWTDDYSDLYSVVNKMSPPSK